MDDRPLPSAAPVLRQVIHRRNDGSPCFFNGEDYLVYLDCLKEAADRYDCAIHAYALLPNEVQLLVSLDSETRLARVMRAASGRYVEYVNYTYQRNGRFWEHGARVTGIDSGQDVLARYHAIESVPVWARLAARAEDYRWSSHRHHACGAEDPVIRDHSSYLDLGATHLARQLAYHELFRQAADGGEAAGATLPPHRDLALGESRRDDGIGRPVPGRGLHFVDAAGPGMRRPRPPAGGAHTRDDAFDIQGAGAGTARRLAAK